MKPNPSYVRGGVLREHSYARREAVFTRELKFSHREVEEMVRKLPKGKAAGTTGIKSEILQVLVEDEKFTERLTEAINRVKIRGGAR